MKDWRIERTRTIHEEVVVRAENEYAALRQVRAEEEARRRRRKDVRVRVDYSYVEEVGSEDDRSRCVVGWCECCGDGLLEGDRTYECAEPDDSVKLCAACGEQAPKALP